MSTRAPLGMAGEGFHKEPPEGGRRCESSTWGVEGVHGRRSEIPGCETPRGMQLDSLRKAILFMPFEMFICVFPNIFPLPPHGVQLQVCGAAVEKQVSCRTRVAEHSLIISLFCGGMFPCRGEGRNSVNL